MGFDGWWESLSFAKQIFYGIGLLSLFSLIIQVILIFFGVGGSDVSDGGADAGHGSGLGILSIKSVTGFFFGFGWAGAIAMNSGMGVMGALIIALLTGTVLMFIIFVLMKGLSSLHSDGTVKLQNAIGQVGTVYLTIPPKGQGNGQIQVNVQGQLLTINALNHDPQEIKNTQKVRVISSVDESTVIVEKI